MSRRSQIQLTPDEQAAFLREPHKAALATLDKDGFPHVVAMSFLAGGRRHLHDLVRQGAEGAQCPPRPPGRGDDRDRQSVLRVPRLAR